MFTSKLSFRRVAISKLMPVTSTSKSGQPLTAREFSKKPVKTFGSGELTKNKDCKVDEKSTSGV